MAASEEPPIPVGPSKVRFDRDDPVVEAFKESLDGLKASMQMLVEENRSLLKALGQQYAPNVGGGASMSPRTQGSSADAAEQLVAAAAAWKAANPPAPAQPPQQDGSESTPERASAWRTSRARAALSSVYGGANWAIDRFGDGPPMSALAEESQQESGRGGGHGGGSTPPSDGGPAWMRMLRPRADEAITMPRYGQFTSQDVLNMGAHALAKFAVPRADSDMGKAVGTVGGALATAGSLAPYLAVMERMSGMSMNKQAIQDRGQEMGYSRAGGPLGLGSSLFGFQVPGSQFFTEAGRESMKEDWNAFKTGLGGGITVKEAKEYMQALRNKGYTGNELQNATKTLTDIRRDPNTSSDVGSPEAMANLYDRTLRFGSNSLDGLKDSIKGMGEVAKKARMSVDEVYNALDQFATEQQHLGGTYAQGMNMGKQFMGVTGMTAEHLSNFQQNGVVQGMFSGTTGLLPTEMGAAPLSANMDAIYKSLDMMGGAYGKLGTRTIKDKYGTLQVSGQAQKEALMAQQFGTTPEVIHNMMKNENRFKTEASLESWTSEYGKAAAGMKNADPSDPHYQDNMDKLSGAMPRLNQIMRDARRAGNKNFSPDEIKKIDNMPVWKRQAEIEKMIDKGRTKPKDDTITISLDPSLKGIFKIRKARGPLEGNGTTVTTYARADPMAAAYSGVDTGLPNNRVP